MRRSVPHAVPCATPGAGPHAPSRARAATFAVLASAALAGCVSTAPHTMGAAAIGSGVALGAAAVSRSAGGCWAVCTDGWVCNPASGWCEKPKASLETGCPPGAAANDPRCPSWNVPAVTGQGGATPSGSGVGYAPATARPPPPPNESSPGGPPKP